MKPLRLSERSDLIQVKSIQELKSGMEIIYGIIPGKERTLIIENKKDKSGKIDPVAQARYKQDLKSFIKMGIVYREK